MTELPIISDFDPRDTDYVTKLDDALDTILEAVRLAKANVTRFNAVGLDELVAEATAKVSDLGVEFHFNPGQNDVRGVWIDEGLFESTVGFSGESFATTPTVLNHPDQERVDLAGVGLGEAIESDVRSLGAPYLIAAGSKRSFLQAIMKSTVIEPIIEDPRSTTVKVYYEAQDDAIHEITSNPLRVLEGQFTIETGLRPTYFNDKTQVAAEHPEQNVYVVRNTSRYADVSDVLKYAYSRVGGDYDPFMQGLAEEFGSSMFRIVGVGEDGSSMSFEHASFDDVFGDLVGAAVFDLGD
ncbi:hypothetical protein HOB85_06590, partial [Candidatus Woesearchaeota archaeon]|nr:hypothetical protein [Candidatus Woesearchaeota archaeon]